MKLIISAATWDKEIKAGMKQVELLPIAKKLGCSGVEFRPLWHNVEEEVAEIKPALDQSGLVCTYASNEALLADSEETTMKALASLENAIYLAIKLGTNTLRFNVAAGPFKTEFVQTSWWQRELSRVVAIAGKHNIRLAVENGPDAKKGDAKLLSRIFTAVDSPVLCLTYDTANWFYANIKPEIALDTFLTKLGYIHLKDVVCEEGVLKHSYPGSGLVDVKGLKERISESGFIGMAALEFPGGDNPEERVLKSLEYLGANKI